MRTLSLMFTVAVFLMMTAAVLSAQMQMSDSDYTQKAMAAAPPAVGQDATIIRMDMSSGTMKTLRTGTNGFTCMVMGTNDMCNDANSMAFFGAMMKHETPTDKTGISYMLLGDDGASNTDPYARDKTADNHWVVTGPHIMLTGAAAKTMGFTEAKDADPGKPYMMWVGTPYEHAMIPVSAK